MNSFVGTYVTSPRVHRVNRTIRDFCSISGLRRLQQNLLLERSHLPNKAPHHSQHQFPTPPQPLEASPVDFSLLDISYKGIHKIRGLALSIMCSGCIPVVAGPVFWSFSQLNDTIFHHRSRPRSVCPFPTCCASGLFHLGARRGMLCPHLCEGLRADVRLQLCGVRA